MADSDANVEFRAVDIIRWERVSVDIRPLELEQSLLDALHGKMEDVLDSADGRSVVVRVSITGRGELSRSVCVIARSQKRLASSRLGWMRLASTPRYPKAGINELFLQSDRRFYFIKCPAYGHEQRLIWKENVDLKKPAVVCSKARSRGLLDLRQPGCWIAEAPGNDRVRGYHLSRLYSPLANLRQMADLIAHALLKQEEAPSQKVAGLGIDLAFGILDRAINRRASRRGPQGVVRR